MTPKPGFSAVVWPLSVDDPTYRALVAAVTGPTVPTNPPPPRLRTRPFQAPSPSGLPPVPPSEVLAGRPTRNPTRWISPWAYPNTSPPRSEMTKSTWQYAGLAVVTRVVVWTITTLFPANPYWGSVSSCAHVGSDCAKVIDGENAIIRKTKLVATSRVRYVFICSSLLTDRSC